MTTPNDNAQATTQGGAFYSLFLGAVIYSALGLLAGLLWTFASPALGLASIGIPTFLALWWAWLLVWMPPILIGITVFRATDPMAQMAKTLSKK